MYNNVTQKFLFGTEPRSLHLEVLDYANVYSQESEFFAKSVRDDWTIEDGNEIIEFAMSLGKIKPFCIQIFIL